MAKKYTTKGRKSRSAGRFGVRYGRKNRKLVADIEERMRQGYKCASCGIVAIHRTDTGIWKCKKCGYTFTGGAYVPYTSAGLMVTRAVKKAIEPGDFLDATEETGTENALPSNNVQVKEPGATEESQ